MIDINKYLDTAQKYYIKDLTDDEKKHIYAMMQHLEFIIRKSRTLLDTARDPEGYFTYYDIHSILLASEMLEERFFTMDEHIKETKIDNL